MFTFIFLGFITYTSSSTQPASFDLHDGYQHKVSFHFSHFIFCLVDFVRNAIGIRAAAVSSISSLLSLHPTALLPVILPLCFPDEPFGSSPHLYSPQRTPPKCSTPPPAQSFSSSSASSQFSSKSNVRSTSPGLFNFSSTEILPPTTRRMILRSLSEVSPHLWCLDVGEERFLRLLNSSESDDVILGLDLVHDVGIWLMRMQNKSSLFAYRKSRAGAALDADAIDPILCVIERLVPLIITHLIHECVGCRSASFRCLSILGPLPGVFCSVETRQVFCPEGK